MNDNVKWFKEAKYGMFIHWGLYSLLAGEHNGEDAGVYAEWIQSKFQIPNAEYEKLATAFNPIYFDADKIVSFNGLGSAEEISQGAELKIPMN